MNITNIAETLKSKSNNIILIYAFNSTGKTRLSVAYKNATKAEGHHTGVYYNAFSEDLFVWENDEENDGDNILLEVKPSSLNRFHSALSEGEICEKLKPYNPKYDFKFNPFKDTEKGIQSISFFRKVDETIDYEKKIKVSRGEERIFVWCFFLALFEVDGWADEQNKHFFIDDPVSSLDDHNIFITATTLFELIEKHSKRRKIIITTHHIGLFSILSDWLTKGEKSSKYKSVTEHYILNIKDGNILLEAPKNNVFLYHLHLLQVLKNASDSDQLYTYHFVLLRQVLENIGSFLGRGQFSFVLNKIGVEEYENATMRINSLSHQSAYQYQTEVMVPDNRALFSDVLGKLLTRYEFSIGA